MSVVAIREKVRQTFDTLPDSGYVRFSQLVPAVIPASRTTLWRWVQEAKFPKPTKLSSGVTAWRVGDVREFLAAQAEGSK